MMKMALSGLFCLFLANGTTAGPDDVSEYMRANLYSASPAGAFLLDGNLTQYDDNFSNSIDNNDAWKMANPGVNFGISRNGVTLVIEKRMKFRFTDTTTFKMWNLIKRAYIIEVITFNCDHPNLLAELEDKFLGTVTPIDCNGTTRVDFAVTDEAGTFDPERFRVVFKFNPLSHIPFTFVGIKSVRNNGMASLQWRVNNEEAQINYEVEKSTDGIIFKPIARLVSVNAASVQDYHFEEQNSSGDVMYRIKSTDFTNNSTCSQVVRLFDEVLAPEISVYPNPVINKRARFFIDSPVSGDYQVYLMNLNGVSLYQTSVSLGVGQVNQSFLFPSALPGGLYFLRICGPGNNTISKKIIIQ